MTDLTPQATLGAQAPVPPFYPNGTLKSRWNLRRGSQTDVAAGTEGSGVVRRTLAMGERVQVYTESPRGWSFVRTSRNEYGWVSTEGIQRDLPKVGPVLGVPVTSVAFGINEHLAPAGDELLSLAQPSATARRLATVWNRYGNFVRAVARKLEIDYRAAVSVFVIEAGSRAYDENNRMIVRCEAHLLERWGGDRTVWSRHFTRDFAAKAWVGHRVRFDPAGEWISYHGNNTLEWQTIELASGLFGRDVAARATSMGLPQVLGDNCRALGYGNASQMLAELQRSTHSQIAGFYDYITRARLIDEIQRREWTAFAASYNGGGQSEYYGRLIASTLVVAEKLLPAG